MSLTSDEARSHFERGAFSELFAKAGPARAAKLLEPNVNRIVAHAAAIYGELDLATEHVAATRTIRQSPEAAGAFMVAALIEERNGHSYVALQSYRTAIRLAIEEKDHESA